MPSHARWRKIMELDRNRLLNCAFLMGTFKTNLFSLGTTYSSKIKAVVAAVSASADVRNLL